MLPVPGESDLLPLLVCGAHLEGMPLHHQLQDRGAQLREKTTTTNDYRLYALPGGARPGLVQASEGEAGVPIQVEVYLIPSVHVGSFLAGIPHPLGLGKVQVASGEMVTGFICAQNGLAGAEDISSYGGWRAYKAAQGQ